MAAGLWSTMGAPVLRDPDSFLRVQLENREENFLETVRRTVFDSERNPYREMLRMAGCDFADLASAVKKDGLETTLAKLLDAGVTLSHDEFKGNVPIVRNGKEFSRGPDAFRNPLVKRGMLGKSGGSRSAGTPIVVSPSRRTHSEAYLALRIREFDLQNRCLLQIRPILPAGEGIQSALSYRRRGHPVDRWYSPTGRSVDSMHYLWATRMLVGLTWLRGQRIPFPRLLAPNDFAEVASWIAARVREGTPCLVTTSPSMAARIAASAIDRGQDIRGTFFLTVSEPLTDGKRRAIEAAGAQVYSSYSISEVGPIGIGCRAMNEGNCVHLFSDSVAVVAKEKRAPLAGIDVTSLHFTTLLPYAGFVLINAEFDDSAVVEKTDCKCEYARAGFRYQLRDIASFGKLTGYGITLVGTDIVEILERALPQRFGGLPTDYQLVEDLAAESTSIQLLVSPRVQAVSLDTVRDYFLHQVRRYNGGASASRLLKDVDAFSVRREEPHMTPRGKILPLHLTAPKNQAV